jgi:hypothetical protein
MGTPLILGHGDGVSYERFWDILQFGLVNQANKPNILSRS